MGFPSQGTTQWVDSPDIFNLSQGEVTYQGGSCFPPKIILRLAAGFLPCHIPELLLHATIAVSAPFVLNRDYTLLCGLFLALLASVGSSSAVLHHVKLQPSNFAGNTPLAWGYQQLGQPTACCSLPWLQLLLGIFWLFLPTWAGKEGHRKQLALTHDIDMFPSRTNVGTAGSPPAGGTAEGKSEGEIPVTSALSKRRSHFQLPKL